MGRWWACGVGQQICSQVRLGNECNRGELTPGVKLIVWYFASTLMSFATCIGNTRAEQNHRSVVQPNGAAAIAGSRQRAFARRSTRLLFDFADRF